VTRDLLGHAAVAPVFPMRLRNRAELVTRGVLCLVVVAVQDGLVHREHGRLSLRELEEKSGVSYNTIWRLEDGRQGAHPRTIRKLAEALGVEPGQLIRDEA
jgi:DNA-binding Xre family transcriptional regulator